MPSKQSHEINDANAPYRQKKLIRNDPQEGIGFQKKHLMINYSFKFFPSYFALEKLLFGAKWSTARTIIQNLTAIRNCEKKQGAEKTSNGLDRRWFTSIQGRKDGTGLVGTGREAEASVVEEGG